MHRALKLLGPAIAATLLLASSPDLAEARGQRQMLRQNRVRLSAAEHARLTRKAQQVDRAIRGGVEITVPEAGANSEYAVPIDDVAENPNVGLRDPGRYSLRRALRTPAGTMLAAGAEMGQWGASRYGHTPIVDLHIAEINGVRWTKPGESDGHIAQEFEITGLAPGQELELVLTAGASGHVMSRQWGGRPWTDVVSYGDNDIIHLVHQTPDGRRTEVVSTPSRGLVTQEGFGVKLDQPGQHTFFYFRNGNANGQATGLGSEPGLCQVKFNLK